MLAPPRFSSLGQFLFYRCVRTVTHHLRSVNFYFTVESEPSLDIITKEDEEFPNLQ